MFDVYCTSVAMANFLAVPEALGRDTVGKNIAMCHHSLEAVDAVSGEVRRT
jgi:hypothetical protein